MNREIIFIEYRSLIRTVGIKSILFLALLYFPVNVVAQTYYQVTATNGTQSVGGNTVTVSQFSGANTFNGYCGSAGPYLIGNTSMVGSAYKYVFSNPVRAIRMHMTATGYREGI